MKRRWCATSIDACSRRRRTHDCGALNRAGSTEAACAARTEGWLVRLDDSGRAHASAVSRRGGLRANGEGVRAGAAEGPSPHEAGEGSGSKPEATWTTITDRRSPRRWKRDCASSTQPSRRRSTNDWTTVAHATSRPEAQRGSCERRPDRATQIAWSVSAVRWHADLPDVRGTLRGAEESVAGARTGWAPGTRLHLRDPSPETRHLREHAGTADRGHGRHGAVDCRRGSTRHAVHRRTADARGQRARRNGVARGGTRPIETEVDRLVASIASGVPAAAVASLIATKTETIRKLEVRLRKPRVPRLGHERLKAALEQRAEQWKAELRAEPHIARMVLRRLVGPLTLWDESERPDFVKREAGAVSGFS